MARRRRHSFQRGAGSILDRRTRAREAHEARYCPICVGEARVCKTGSGATWRCVSCHASGKVLPSGDLVAFQATKLPRVEIRYRRDGSRVEA